MTVPPDTIPHILADRYEIERELGRGASAYVYLARDRRHDRQVAVKVLRPELAETIGAERFLREIQVTARLQHPHIVSVLDAGAENGRLYLVAPYLDGGTLRERLTRDRQLPIGTAVAIARAVATALDHAHTRGLIHRDVKPENILFAGDEPYLADFGIARVLDDAIGWTTTTTGIVRGTPAYMSPEQASGDRIDGRSDVYALGCVLYEMLAGVMPFHGATSQAMLAQRFVHPPEALVRYRKSVPLELDTIVTRALAVAAADRWESAQAFANALATMKLGDGRTPAPLPAPNYVRRTLTAAALTATVTLVMRLTWNHDPAGDTTPARHDNSTRIAASTGEPTYSFRLYIAAPLAVTERDRTIASHLSDAIRAELSGWTDVRLVADARAGDWTLVPTVATLDDSVRVAIVVHDARGESAEERALQIVPVSEAAARSTVATLVREALAGSNATSIPGIAVMRGRSFTGLQRYVDGWRALRAGALDSASARFRSAMRSDSSFAYAALWAAQSAAWGASKDVDRWKTDASVAIRTGMLHGADSAHAEALVAMGNGDYPAACASFRFMSQRDVSSFPASFGLGECARADSLIIRTPGGWRFRSSHWDALKHYREAVDRAPTAELMAALFDRVVPITYASGNRPRRGRTREFPDIEYWALPSLDSDTIAFHPIPQTEFVGLGARAAPTSYMRAVRQGRNLALELTGNWTSRFPTSGSAWLERSLALEYAGQIRSGDSRSSASAALDRAATQDITPIERARLAVARVRLALRRYAFDSAGIYARQALMSSSTKRDVPREQLAPLAALVGNVDAALRLTVPSTDPFYAVLPQALADSVQTFRVRALLGQCARLDTNLRALERSFAVAFAPAELQSQRQRLLMPAYREAVPCLGPGILHDFADEFPMDRVYRALAERNPQSAGRLIQSLRQQRVGANIGGISWDHLYSEAWSLSQVGDSTLAVTELESALDDIASMSTYTLDYMSQAAGLQRAITLFAELAGRRRNSTAAAVWKSRAHSLLYTSPLH